MQKNPKYIELRFFLQYSGHNTVGYVQLPRNIAVWRINIPQVMCI